MRRVFAGVRQGLADHFFSPLSIRYLAWTRITLVGTQLLFFLPSLDYQIWLTQIDEDLFSALPALKVLLLPFGWGARPELMFLETVWGVAVVAGVFALFGYYTRWALLAFAATNTLMIAHEYSYGEIHHPETLMIIALWLLAVTKCGSALSVDSVRKRLSGVAELGVYEELEGGQSVSWHGRWPLRVIQWLLVLAYLSAGVSKLTLGGMDWFNGYTLSYYLGRDALRHGGAGLLLADQIPLLAALSVGTVLFELLFGVAVLVPSLAWLFVAAGTLLHVGIYITQRAPFWQYIALYVAFLPEIVGQFNSLGFIASRGRQRKEDKLLSIMYDGSCQLCLRTICVLDIADASSKLGFIDLETEWNEVGHQTPELTRKGARSQMFAIDREGSLYGGARAFRQIFRQLWMLRPVAALMSIDWVDRLADSLYRKITKRRHSWFCDSEACRLED